jgi:hypothetical protein
MTACEWVVIVLCFLVLIPLAVGVFVASERASRARDRVRAWYDRPGIDLDHLDGLDRDRDRRGRP